MVVVRLACVFILFLLSGAYFGCGRAQSRHHSDLLLYDTDGCFAASTDPVIATRFTAQSEYHESNATIEAIELLIWNHRFEIDPRLVYYRMIGESNLNPFAVNKSSGAYGLFQFLGKPRGSKKTYREILEAEYAANPHASPRLIQVRYYLEHYLATAIEAADEGYGCVPSKNFAEYSDIEKSAYLGWGSCGKLALQKELNLCKNVSSYRDGSCAFAGSLVRGEPSKPVCDGP